MNHPAAADMPPRTKTRVHNPNGYNKFRRPLNDEDDDDNNDDQSNIDKIDDMQPADSGSDESDLDNDMKDDKLDIDNSQDQINSTEEHLSITLKQSNKKSTRSVKLIDEEANTSSPADLLNKKLTRKSKKYLRNEKGINQHSKSNAEYDPSGYDSDNNINDNNDRMKLDHSQESILNIPKSANKKTSKSSKASNINNTSTNQQITATSSSSSQQGNNERVWVQCNTCDKWRSLPSTVDPDKLPDIWTCDLNIYDNERNYCDAPEESYKDLEEEKHTPLKSFFKVWVKKLKSSDRAESRLSSTLTRGNKKKKLDVEWIQCSNPSCSKWRAISRNIDTNLLFKRLNKNKHYGGPNVWYCSMNSWDDTKASCSAPQEPLYNCKWNINHT